MSSPTSSTSTTLPSSPNPSTSTMFQTPQPPSERAVPAALLDDVCIDFSSVSEPLPEQAATSSSSSATEKDLSAPSEEEDDVIYSHDQLLFSSLGEKKFRFALVWKDWAPRCVRIHRNGTLSHARNAQVKVLPTHVMYLRNIEVTLMADASAMHEEYADHDELQEEGAPRKTIEAEHGLMVKCYTADNIETYFRCVLSVSELDKFLSALMKATGEHNLTKLTTTQLTDITLSPAMNRTPGLSGVSAIGNFAESISNTIQSSHKRPWNTSNKPAHVKKNSIMRRAIARAMDKYDQRSKLERVVARRGAFDWLPVIGSNDLIHGSWWFVIGSIGVVATTLVVIYNKYYLVLSDDDSTLTKSGFVVTWLLLCVSGIFSTLGSLAFVRAFHEDPPMRPMFPSFYHTQSDELLASWLFFFAMIPFIPYCLIFLSEERSHSLLYLIALVFSILVCLGSLLFVRACYPSDRLHRDILLPLSKYLCCCCSADWRERHMMNDWLGGSWLFYWASLLATFACVVLTIVALAEGNALQTFIYGTSFFENIAFLVGSAYFVAGSYPEGFADGQHVLAMGAGLAKSGSPQDEESIHMMQDVDQSRILDESHIEEGLGEEDSSAVTNQLHLNAVGGSGIELVPSITTKSRSSSRADLSSSSSHGNVRYSMAAHDAF